MNKPTAFMQGTNPARPATQGEIELAEDLRMIAHDDARGTLPNSIPAGRTMPMRGRGVARNEIKITLPPKCPNCSLKLGHDGECRTVKRESMPTRSMADLQSRFYVLDKECDDILKTAHGDCPLNSLLAETPNRKANQSNARKQQ